MPALLKLVNDDHPETFSFSIDVDECSTNTHNCDTNADCTNTDVSFTCACQYGWTGDGKTCTGTYCLLSLLRLLVLYFYHLCLSSVSLLLLSFFLVFFFLSSSFSSPSIQGLSSFRMTWERVPLPLFFVISLLPLAILQLEHCLVFFS